jgi:hypothetical protein
MLVPAPRSLSTQTKQVAFALAMAAFTSCKPAPGPVTLPSQTGSASCAFTYGGESRLILASATQDPYAAPLHRVFPRFAARIVNLSSPADLASFALYVYDADAADSDVPVLLHESKYYPPYRNSSAYGFTGLQFAYKTGLGEELSYYCEVSQ